jgi:hypothetical protein
MRLTDRWLCALPPLFRRRVTHAVTKLIINGINADLAEAVPNRSGAAGHSPVVGAPALASWTCPHCQCVLHSVMPHVAERWAATGCRECEVSEKADDTRPGSLNVGLGALLHIGESVTWPNLTSLTVGENEIDFEGSVYKQTDTGYGELTEYMWKKQLRRLARHMPSLSTIAIGGSNGMHEDSEDLDIGMVHVLTDFPSVNGLALHVERSQILHFAHFVALYLRRDTRKWRERIESFDVRGEPYAQPPAASSDVIHATSARLLARLQKLYLCENSCQPSSEDAAPPGGHRSILPALRALPGLRILRINIGAFGSLRGAVAIANACPALTHLWVSIDSCTLRKSADGAPEDDQEDCVSYLKQLQAHTNLREIHALWDSCAIDGFCPSGYGSQECLSGQEFSCDLLCQNFELEGFSRGSPEIPLSDATVSARILTLATMFFDIQKAAGALAILHNILV